MLKDAKQDRQTDDAPHKEGEPGDKLRVDDKPPQQRDHDPSPQPRTKPVKGSDSGFGSFG